MDKLKEYRIYRSRIYKYIKSDKVFFYIKGIFNKIIIKIRFHLINDNCLYKNHNKKISCTYK
jgi:hypothetical protein